jgi:WD40 repeat protein
MVTSPALKTLRLKALLPALLALSGCHVAQQAADAFKAKDNSNYLHTQDIHPFSAIPINEYPRSTHQGAEVLFLKALESEQPTVLTVGQDGRVIGWNVTTGEGHEIQRLPAPPKLVTLGESKALIAWSDDKGVSISCLRGCSQVKTLSNVKSRPASLTFHDRDTTLLIGGSDGRIYRWRFMDEQDASSMEEQERMIERYVGHQTMVSGVVGHSVGRAFFSSDWDGRLIGWLSYTADDFGGKYDKNVFRGRFYTDIPAAMIASRPGDRGISSLALSSDGEYLAVGTEDGFVEVWRVKGFMLAARKSLHQGRVTNVALSSDGSRVASVGKDSKVRVHSLASDPMFTISPTALPNLLEEISEHHIPLAHRATFVSAERVAVGTKGGEVVEVKLARPVPTAAPSAPKPTPRSRDNDY